MATTKEIAANLNITGKQLRRILRSFDRFADGTYTRYNLGKRDIEQVTKALENRAPKPTPKKVKKLVKKIARKQATKVHEMPAPTPEQPTAA